MVSTRKNESSMSHKLFILVIFLFLLEAAALWAFFTAFAPYEGAAFSPKPRSMDRITQAATPGPKEIILKAGKEPETVSPDQLIVAHGEIDDAVLGEHLLALAAKTVRPAQNAELTIENGQATHFVPDLSGQDLDLALARKQALEELAASTESKLEIVLPVREEAAARRLGELNDLGLETLISQGITDFTGSSQSRITNIRVGAARYNGVIIAPGEEFAFNEHLGPIDAAHGFLPELVIKPEGTVPEFGGGLCQVSTTAFRAAFFAGLPITARRNHAYAVKYYEWIADDQPRAPGLDATIYPGALDLKFINDTPGALLIWTRIEGKRLYFDFYGSPDGREMAVDGPHPFDRKPSGAVKSTVTRRVTKNGETAEATFNSNYVSPDKYPRVTEYPKPVEPSPLPDNPNNPNPTL